MNVEYRCPQCNGRLFAAPGGTRMMCPKCQIRYEQTEAWQGDLDRFAFKDEKGETHITNPDEHFVATHTDEENRDYLRERYREVTGGKHPDGRWKVDTLLEEIQDALNEKQALNIDTNAQVEA